MLCTEKAVNSKITTGIDHKNTPLNLSLRPRPNSKLYGSESLAIIVYSDVAISPRFGGKRDVTHMIYVKIKPYHFLCCFDKDGMVSNFSLNKKINLLIYFYVIKTPLYTIITGDSQTHIISNLGLGCMLQTTEPKLILLLIA